jgi:DNA-directed RNA polymerase specialized sigma24 family protein
MIEDFTTSYDLYKDAILRYCLWKSNNRDVGQDLMQETFLRFWICLRNEKKITHTARNTY